LAEDDLTDEAIAEVVGVTKRTITNWKQDPEFAALVGEYHGQIIAQALKLPIAKKHYRVATLNMIHDRTLQAIEHRASAYQMDDSPLSHAVRVFGDDAPPEASTGLFMAKRSISATGKPVTDWVFDSALVKEIRELEKQAAQELGQWSEQSKVEVDGGMRLEIVGMADEDLP
jgi:hypothetical protein